jgi:hypothetical protein
MTIVLDTQQKLTFQDFHTLVNSHTPGLKLDRDIITNPNPVQGFYISTTNPRASRAVATVAKEYNLEVVRVDLTSTTIIEPDLIGRVEYLDYEFTKTRLLKHLKDTKNQSLPEEKTRFDVKHLFVGGDKAIKQLEISDHTEAPEPVPAIEIVWRLRNVWAKQAWMWILKASDLQEGVDNAFAAATNFYLGPDWFHLGHNQNIFFEPTITPKAKPPEDWTLALEKACKLAVKHFGSSILALDMVCEKASEIIDPYDEGQGS